MRKDFVKILLIFVICIILAFGACLLCACLFDRVEPLASAETVTLPSDGVVGFNYIRNSGDFQDFSYWSYPSAFSSISSGTITFSGQTAQSYPFQPLSQSFNSGTTLTFSLYVTSVSGRVYLWCRDVTNNTIDSNVITLGVFSCSFTLTASGVPQFAFSIPVGSSISFHWIKAEVGSQFTGYVPNYDQIEYDTLNDYFVYNDGWTNYSVMGDFLHNNSQLQYLTSPNGGSITFVASFGTLLSSSSNGTQFVYSPNQIEFNTSNSSHTVAILIDGTISSGDVVLSLKYTKYEGVNDFWQGSSPIGMNDQYNLSSGLSIFNYVGNNAAEMTLTLRSGVSVYLLAYKVETGTYFTRFPYSTVADQSSFSNGYNAGLISGTEQGYSQGLDEGYTDGYTEGYDRGQEVFYPQGYTNGYNDGILTADEGTWSNMLSSLINLPVTFILSLIHFEVLGFDFANVFRIIVLFSLLSFIITKVLKGII